ncbi:hypothetical protein QYF61_025995 [Mycteria americana]|uniref:Uncharacterized protein n=1 Tax=Mycteria americana TaxID=33587 RepID=A0AAN7N4B3_MYCAM|nr:hypothetical protein QYF61_025995 [Mycteria americana]
MQKKEHKEGISSFLDDSSLDAYERENRVKNHGTVWVRRDLQRSPSSNPSAMGRDIFHQTRWLKAPSNLTLNNSNDGASTTPLGNQCLSTLIFKTITPCPIATGPTKKSVPIFLTSPLEVLKSCNKVSLEPSLLQAEQPQLSQPFLTAEVFQPSDHLHVPPLDPLQQVDACLVLRTPDLDAVLQGGLSRAEQRGRILSLDLLATLLWMQPRIRLPFWAASYPQVLLRRAALNPFIPQSVLILGIALAQVQDLALGLVEPHEVHTGPLLKPVQVPQDGIPPLKKELPETPHAVGISPSCLTVAGKYLTWDLGFKDQVDGLTPKQLSGTGTHAASPGINHHP